MYFLTKHIREVEQTSDFLGAKGKMISKIKAQEIQGEGVNPWLEAPEICRVIKIYLIGK